VRRVILATILGSGTLLLAGCGSSTITATQAGYSAVVSSDSDAITALKAKLPSNLNGATLHDGDAHSGPHICGFNASKNGHTYQVDFYGTLPSGVNGSELCSDSVKQSFLKDTP